MTKEISRPSSNDMIQAAKTVEDLNNLLASDITVKCSIHGGRKYSIKGGEADVTREQIQEKFSELKNSSGNGLQKTGEITSHSVIRLNTEKLDKADQKISVVARIVLVLAQFLSKKETGAESTGKTQQTPNDQQIEDAQSTLRNKLPTMVSDVLPIVMKFNVASPLYIRGMAEALETLVSADALSAELTEDGRASIYLVGCLTASGDDVVLLGNAPPDLKEAAMNKLIPELVTYQNRASGSRAAPHQAAPKPYGEQTYEEQYQTRREVYNKMTLEQQERVKPLWNAVYPSEIDVYPTQRGEAIGGKPKVEQKTDEPKTMFEAAKVVADAAISFRAYIERSQNKERTQERT